MGDVTTIALTISPYEKGWEHDEPDNRFHIDKLHSIFEDFGCGCAPPTQVDGMAMTRHKPSVRIFVGAWKLFPRHELIDWLTSLEWEYPASLFFKESMEDGEFIRLDTEAGRWRADKIWT